MKKFVIFFLAIWLGCFLVLPAYVQAFVVKVETGDTLWNIAEKYLGNPNLWEVLADYNDLKNPQLLHKLDSIKIPEMPKVILTVVVGEVKIKCAGKKEFVELKEGDYLNPYDEILVGTNSRAQIELEDKSVIQVKPNTNLRIKLFFFKETQTLRTKLQIFQGKVTFKKSKDTPHSEFELETPGVLCGVRGTQFQTEYTEKEVSRVSVFEGEVAASAAKKEVKIPAGYGSQVIKGEPPLQPRPLPPAPSLLEPVDNHIADIVPLHFKWDTAERAVSYRVELSKDEAFNVVVYDITGTETTLVVPPLETGKYYWHISGIDELGLEGAFSLTRLLTIEKKELPPVSPPLTPLLSAPSLLEPVDNYTTDIAQLHFKWDTAEHAVSYRVELSRDEAFNVVVYSVSGTETTLSVPPLDTGKYYWHVSGINESGLEGTFSLTRLLSIEKEIKPPKHSKLKTIIFVLTGIVVAVR